MRHRSHWTVFSEIRYWEPMSRKSKFGWNRTKLGLFTLRLKYAVFSSATLNPHTSALFQWNGIKLLRWPRRYKHHANVPQRNVIRTTSILLTYNFFEHIQTFLYAVAVSSGPQYVLMHLSNTGGRLYWRVVYIYALAPIKYAINYRGRNTSLRSTVWYRSETEKRQPAQRTLRNRDQYDRK